MKYNLFFKELTVNDIPEISILGQQLNPKLTIEQIQNYFIEMFQFSTYHCFGLLQNDKIISITSGWITIRLYSGKQLELDNVVVDNTLQSKGIGKFFFESLEAWAKENNCITVELNTYVHNSRSHKFYFNSGYKIAGFHFQKHI